MSPAQRAALAVILLVALVLKVLALMHTGPDIDADEAMIGIMAEGMLQGVFTIFYWGQPYMAPLESLVLAPLVALLGPNPWVIKALALAFFMVWMVSTWALGRRTVGIPATLWALAFLAVSPLFLHIWGLKLRGGFISLCAAGNVLLCLCWDLSLRPSARPVWRAVLLGGLMGAFFYWYFLSVEYILPALLMLSRPPLPSGQRWKPAVAGVAGFLVGASSVWVYNLHPRTFMATWDYMTLTPEHGVLVGAHLQRLFSSELAILFGVLPPWQHSLPESMDAAAWMRVTVLMVPCALSVVGLLVWGLRSVQPWWDAQEGAARGWAPHAMVALACAGAYVLTQFGDWVEPRFLLPLYVPLFLALGAVVHALPGPCGALVLGAWAVATTQVAAATDGPLWHTPMHRAEIGHPFPPPRALAAELERRGLTEISGDYWNCKPLQFVTWSRVTCRDQYTRTPWMRKRVERAPLPMRAIMRDEGRPPLMETERLLGALGLRAERFTFERQVVLHHLQWPNAAVAREHMSITTQHNPKDLERLMDLDTETRWTSGLAQSEGTATLEVTLEVPMHLSAVRMFNGDEDHPRHLQVEGSLDGETWVDLARVRVAARPEGGVLVVPLAGVAVQHVRVSALQDAGTDLWFSVRELVLVERPVNED